MKKEDVEKMREILRNWGWYGPWPNGMPGGTFHKFPVDEMTDDQIVQAAAKIAEGGRGEGDD